MQAGPPPVIINDVAQVWPVVFLGNRSEATHTKGKRPGEAPYKSSDQFVPGAAAHDIWTEYRLTVEEDIARSGEH